MIEKGNKKSKRLKEGGRKGGNEEGEQEAKQGRCTYSAGTQG